MPKEQPPTGQVDIGDDEMYAAVLTVLLAAARESIHQSKAKRGARSLWASPTSQHRRPCPPPSDGAWTNSVRRILT